jgi:hypothetical protein
VISSESSIRTSLNNRDAYLIRIVPAHGLPFLARMIDDYPSYADALPDGLRLPGSSFSIELQRAAFCDQTPEEHQSRAGHGTVIYEVNESPVQSTAFRQNIVRCFLALHGSWKNAKSVEKGEGWK